MKIKGEVIESLVHGQFIQGERLEHGQYITIIERGWNCIHIIKIENLTDLSDKFITRRLLYDNPKNPIGRKQSERR